MSKKVLFVSFYAPPFNMVATDRAIKYLQTFVSKEMDITLITADVTHLKSSFNDQRSLKKIDEKIKVIRVPFLFGLEPNFFFNKKGNLFFRLINFFFTGVMWRLTSDLGWGWMKPLGKKIEELCTNQKFDLIICSGGPFLSFLPVSKLAKKYAIPYVLDYRDTWADTTHHFFGQFSFIPRLLERKVNKNSKKIITVSEGCKHSLAKTCDVIKINTIYNFPSMDYISSLNNLTENIQETNNDFFKIVFTGSMYKGRSFIPLLSAFDLMDKEILKKIKVIYCGSHSDFVQQCFEKKNYSQLLDDRKMVSKNGALILSKSADLCLNVVYDEPDVKYSAFKGIITTKIFDYLLLNKIVLNICPNENEVRNLKTKKGIKNLYNFNGAQSQEIASFLLDVMYGSVKPLIEEGNLFAWENQDFSWIDN